MQFGVNFQLVVSWFDQRLAFRNLKQFPAYSNLLSNQEQEKIWFPGKKQQKVIITCISLSYVLWKRFIYGYETKQSFTFLSNNT